MPALQIDARVLQTCTLRANSRGSGELRFGKGSGYQTSGCICVTRPPGSCTVAAVGELKLMLIGPSLPIGNGIRYMHDAHWPPPKWSSVPVAVTPLPELLSRPTTRYHIGPPSAV